MEKYREEEAEVLGFEAGSADSSNWSVTALPGMHEAKVRARYDEDTSLIQQQKGANSNETKGGDKKEKAEPFMFSDPSSRWFEFNQMVDRMTSRRIDKHADLRNQSGIYTIKDKFTEEVATKLVRKEFENKVPFTKAEVRKLINGYVNLRIRTWLDLLTKQGLAAYIASFGTVVEMDEKGEIVDYGETNHDWSISEDRKNPFHQDQLDAILANEEEQVLEKALQKMSERHTRRSMEQLAVNAAILNRSDIVDLSILADFTNDEINYLAFHGQRALSQIIEELYPVPKSVKQKKHRIPRTPFKILKENRRGSAPLFNENEKNGAVVIVSSKDKGELSNPPADYPEYDDAA